MRANESDSRENFTRANGEASDKATAKATANFGAGASKASGEAKATAKATAAAQALYKAKYFVIALLLAVVAITSVGVSKWNIHIQQIYNNNFSYVQKEGDLSTSGGDEPILTRYLTIDYTETAQNTQNAPAQQKTAFYRDTLKAENPTTFTYNGGSFDVKVSDDEYSDLQTDENGNYLKDANGNYLQNNPDASLWSEWAEVGLGFTYAYKRTARINSIGQTVGCSEPLTDGALPTNAGVYQCVIKATTNDNYNTTQTSSKKAAVDAAITQLNYVTNPNDGTEQCAAVISFTIKQRGITVSVADKTSTYGDDHLSGNPLTATTDDAVANAENTTDNNLSPDLNTIVRLYTTKTENGTASEYELERTSPAGKYGIEGSALKKGATDLINENYKVDFVYPGEATQTQGQQTVAFNGEREAEANPIALYVGAGATAVASLNNTASNTAVFTASNTASNLATVSNVAGKPQAQPVANGGVALLDGESPATGTETGNSTATNGTYTITTRNITVTIDNQTSIYGDAIKDLTYKLKEEDGTLANEDKLENIIRLYTTDQSDNAVTLLTTTDVGTYIIKGSQYNAEGQIINANYDVTFVGKAENKQDGVYTITKRPVTITWGETAFSYVYNGAEQKPNPTFDGLLSGHNATVTVAPQSGSSLTSGESINKGDYTMTVALPSQNYKWSDTDNSDNKTQGFSITARPITVTIENKDSVYGNPIEQFTAQVTSTHSPAIVSGDSASDIYTLSTEAKQTSPVGTYDIIGECINANYAVTFVGKAENGKDGVYTIKPAEITKPQITPYSGTYDGKAHDVTTKVSATTVNDQQITVEYKTNNDDWTSTIPTITDAGSVTFNVRISAPNHNTLTLTESYTATINKAELTATASSHTITYGDNAPSYSITYSGFVNGETDTTAAGFTAPTISCNYQKGSPVTTDGYAVTLSGGSATNYSFKLVNGKVTVNKATVTVPTATSAFVYDGTEHTAITDYNTALITIAGTNTATNVGNYAATATLQDTTNYKWSDGDENATKSFSWAITAAPLTVKADNFTITKGSPKPTFTATYDGFVNNETPSVLSGTLGFDCSYDPSTSDAGTYTITPKGLTSNNYIITFQPGTLTVTQAEVVDKPTQKFTTATYDGTDKQLLNGVDLTKMTVTLNGTNVTDVNALTAKNAGTYTVTVTLKNTSATWSGGGNASLTFNFKINKAEFTDVTVTPYTGIYDAAEHTVATKVTAKTVDNKTLTWIVSGASNTLNVQFSANSTSGWSNDKTIINAVTDDFYVKVSDPDGNHNDKVSTKQEALISKCKLSFNNIINENYNTNGVKLSPSLLTNLTTENSHTITPADILTITKAYNYEGITKTDENAGKFYFNNKDVIKVGSTYQIFVELTTSAANNYYFGTNENTKTASTYLKYKTAKVGETYYTIEDALNAGGDITLASNSTGEKTYVITAFSKLGLSGSSADDPFVAYKADYNYTNSSKIILPYDSGKNSSSITEEAPKGVTTYVGSVLVLQAGITLNVSGFIDVTACIIHTGVTRARGVIMNHGTINVTTGGTITSYGYIKGIGTIDLADGAIMTDIFKIYDWMGGRNSLGIVDNATGVFPISAYSLHNTSCHVKINYGARYKAKFYACTSAANFDETLTIVGINEANTMFKLSSGYIDKSAGESLTNPGTALSTITGSNQIKGQRDNIQINGVCTDGTVSISKSGYVIDSSPSRPIPIGYMSVVVNEGTLNLHNVSYKFLPGSSLTISTNGTLSVGSNITTWFYSLEQCIIDDKVTYTNNNNPSVYNYAFATETGGNVVDRQDAYLQVDGIATFATGSSIAGLIKTQSDSATLTINGKTQATINILKSIAYNSSSWGGSNVTTGTSTNTATADILISATTSDVRSLAPGVYYSKNLNDNYVWYANKATLTYNTNGGSSIQSQERTISQTGYVITSTDVSYIPTKDNYTFVNWYMDNNWQTLAEGQTIFTSCNLYAKWEPVKYTITYNILYDDGVSSSGTVINDNPTEYTIESNFYLVSPIDGDLKFINWCKDQSCTIKITQIVSMSGDLTIYGKFYNSNLSVYTVDYVTNNSDYTIAQQSILSTNASSFVPEDLSSRNTDKDYMYRFEGWYTTPTFDTGTEFVTLTDSCTLYAKWSEKIEIMLSIDGSEYAGTQKYVNPGDSGTIPGIEALNIDGHRTITQAIEGCALDGNQYTVSSGATTVKIKIDRKKLYDVQLIITNATVTINGKSYNSNGTIEKIAIEGETITFSISFPSGYINQKWSIKGITPDQEGDSAISNRTFTMPAQKVTIEASSAEKSSGGCSIKETNNTPPAVMPIFTTFVATLLGGYILVSKKKRKNNKAI